MKELHSVRWNEVWSPNYDDEAKKLELYPRMELVWILTEADYEVGYGETSKKRSTSTTRFTVGYETLRDLAKIFTDLADRLAELHGSATLADISEQGGEG